MMYLTSTRRQMDPMTSLRRLNNLLDEAFGWTGDREGSSGTITSAWLPPVDIFEDKDGLKIIAEIPGVDPENVRLSVENNMLTIRGEKRQVAEETSERVHRYERTYGSFERTFALPATVEADDIDAEYENGLLTISLPKSEKARPREISVRSGSRSGERKQVEAKTKS